MKNRFKIIMFDDIKMVTNNQEYMIIDLRGKQEYLKGHVEGAVNIPDFTNKQLNGLSRSKKYILYCSRGSLSFKIGRIMAEKGFEVMVVAGGYKKY